MKKIFFALVILSVLVLPAYVFAQSESGGFQPLTDIQALQFTGNSDSLPDFLNSVYKVAIGLAAVIGVLQLMRAGLTWMTAGGSHEKIGEARGLIRDTFLGLLLVLAPTIVFSLINPDILSLRIGSLDDLRVGEGIPAEKDVSHILWKDTSSPREYAEARCKADRGTIIFRCVPKDGPARTVPLSEACAAGEDGISFCQVTKDTSIGTCNEYVKKVPVDNGTICDATKSFTQINQQCCNITEGLCCGSKSNVVDDFRGGAPAPVSLIPNTIGTANPKPNTGCRLVQDGQVLDANNSPSALCCTYQQSATVSCSVVTQSNTNLSQTNYCTCKYK